MKKVKHGGVFTAILSIISIGYIFPILLVFINSFKKKAYISRKPFDIPTGKMYVGLDHSVYLHVRLVYCPCKKCID